MMVNDRYGFGVSAANSISIIDTDLKYDGRTYEDEIGWKLQEFDRGQFSTAYEVDVGAGEIRTPIAAVLFAGERIEKSALAWSRMASRMKSLLNRGRFTDANGALLLALEKVFALEGTRNIRLLGYKWVDPIILEIEELDVAFDAVAKLDEIEPRDQQFGQGLHGQPLFLFKFDVDGTNLFVIVNGAEVRIRG